MKWTGTQLGLIVLVPVPVPPDIVSTLEVGVFTARIRKMGEGNIFSLCVSSHPGMGGYLHLPIGGGGVGGGYTILPNGGYSILPDGGTPSFLTGGTPIRSWLGEGGGEYTTSELDGGTLPLELEFHSFIGTGWGYPPMVGGGSTPPPGGRQSSRVSTCYAAGGMPLAFTQEDFLVTNDLKMELMHIPVSPGPVQWYQPLRTSQGSSHLSTL